MKKYKEKKLGYKIVKPILSPLFKLYFNPKIIGKENIPKNDSFVLCGNHRNVHDQFPVMVNTKRVIHYIAKKEYFDSKMGWFFKFVGQIKVDREIKDEDAKQEALNILEKRGAVGIFPEGTRNILYTKKEVIDEIYKSIKNKISKEDYLKLIKKQETKLSQALFLKELYHKKRISKKEYQDYLFDIKKSLTTLKKENKITKNEYDDSLLLPFKYGAVSLAKKTNSLVLPFVIKGSYKFRSKDLKVIIGKPYKIKNNLTDENEKLRNTIIKLLKD